MIPTSYLFKDLYIERWGDPYNPNAVETDRPAPPRGDGLLSRIVGPIASHLGSRHHRSGDAWSFVIRS